MKYAYIYDGKLYLNITNKCSNKCSFCIRNDNSGIGGNDLWLSGDADFEGVKKALGEYNLDDFNEVIFCGFGEPVCNLEVLKQTAKYLKDMGKTIRLNTNGQGNLINGRNIVPELKGLIDIVSISLNASDAEKYQDICRSKYGISAYDAVLEFAALCSKELPQVIMSKVDEGDEAENEKCRLICEKLGVKFRLRKMI